ncbi:hypothetical protein [Paenibacillus methanolicus]|uniref:Uncharacterized protein n=1 Tax=Paenibacillus methanolicus TaxID=582686 RepID=A0A5S5CE59_9BACL|nr:hypothetical protein [Paenibacillus methanolicus]TYP77627.1 hypothetical protein BCM02_102188 [Paenibacillus methanolicus]
MPYRSIDLQVSVPKVTEQSIAQQHAIHKAHAEQTKLETDMVKHTEQLRSKNTAVESGGHAHINDHRLKEDTGSKRKGRRKATLASGEEEKNAEDAPKGSKHPFKGKHIDISF